MCVCVCADLLCCSSGVYLYIMYVSVYCRFSWHKDKLQMVGLFDCSNVYLSVRPSIFLSVGLSLCFSVMVGKERECMGFSPRFISFRVY